MVSRGPTQDPATAPSVATIMAREVVTVTADLSVESLLQLLIERGISGVPVVDEAGRARGLVSKTDLLLARHLAAGTELAHEPRLSDEDLLRLELEGGGMHVTELATATVGEIMSPLVFSLPEGATIPQAAALMAYEGVHRAPVLDEDHKVVGIVSSLDVLRWVGREYGFVVPDRRAPTPGPQE
jgi:CBS domain-containing protein